MGVESLICKRSTQVGDVPYPSLGLFTLLPVTQTYSSWRLSGVLGFSIMDNVRDVIDETKL